MSDQGPPTSGSEPAPPRPSRPVKKVAKKRPAGAKSSASKARATKKKAAATAAAGTSPTPAGDSQATVRGAIVIAVTIIVGLLVFWQGFSHDASETVASGPDTTVAPADDRDAAPSTTAPEQGTTLPSTPVTKVPPAEINVIVANNVDPSQTIAGPAADTLSAAGYPAPVTMDLPPFGDLPTSVYYTDDLESEAQAIAVVLGLPDSAVNPIPTPAPTPMNTAQILVVFGTDGT